MGKIFPMKDVENDTSILLYTIYALKRNK